MPKTKPRNRKYSSSSSSSEFEEDYKISKNTKKPDKKEYEGSDFDCSDDDEIEFSVTRYEKNVQPSAVQLLTQIPDITSDLLFTFLHTARLVPPIEDMYDHICTYLGNSQEHNYGIKILDIYRIAMLNEPDFNKQEFRGKLRMLLWHGTQAQYVPLILQNGFKRPKLASGQMFGSGLYFADRASKSANYTRVANPGAIGYLFLCDVILGEMCNARQSHQEYQTPPQIKTNRGQLKPCDSVKCTGEYIPEMSEQIKFQKSIIPFGQTVQNMKYANYAVKYNEFIVYDDERVKIKYLVKVEFTQGKIVY